MTGTGRAVTLATLLLAACPASPAPGGEQQAAPVVPAPGAAQPEAPGDTKLPQTAPIQPGGTSQSPQPANVAKPDSQAASSDLERVVFPAKPACPGGLDIPEFDPAKAPWWAKLTAAQRVAFLKSGAHKHWSAVTESPIALHRTRTGLVLRSVDGCWRQELSTERDVELIDGLSGVAWAWHPQGLRLVDLWSPGESIAVLAEPVKAEDIVFVGGDESVLLQWSDLKAGTLRKGAPRAKLQWSASPRFVPAGLDAVARPLTPAGERWLVEHLDRQAPGPRMTRIRLFPAPGLPAESRCKDPSVCLNAAPFGASDLEVVYYGENENIIGEYEGGPVCAFFEPSSGLWYKDPTRATKAPEPRQFDVNETLCETWLFDVTGRAYLREGQVCASTQCVRAEGEPLGFVRGNIFISI